MRNALTNNAIEPATINLNGRASQRERMCALVARQPLANVRAFMEHFADDPSELEDRALAAEYLLAGLAIHIMTERDAELCFA